MAFQLSGCQLPPGPLMSLKTINRKSIFLMLTRLVSGNHLCQIRAASFCSPGTYTEHAGLCSCTCRGNRNLTWLHRSGHWVLCEGGHWLGYKPVQSRCWCLRERDRDSMRVTDRCGCLTASTLQHRLDAHDSVIARGVLDHSGGCRQHTEPTVTMATVGKLRPPGEVTKASDLSSLCQDLDLVQMKYLPITWKQVRKSTQE